MLSVLNRRTEHTLATSQAYFRIFFIVPLFFFVFQTTFATDRLSKALYGFQYIQASAKTKVWWFHGEDRSTEEGMAADLEAFARVGIGGVVWYDQVHGRGEGSTDAMSDEWWHDVKYAARKAQELGLTFEINVSNGYVAGGPWITPALSMKRLECRGVNIQRNSGINQTFAMPKFNDWSSDVAVIAVRRMVHTMALISRDTIIKRTDGAVDFVQDMGHPVRFCNITYRISARGKAATSATNIPESHGREFVGTGYRVLPDWASVQISDDGKTWRTIKTLPAIYKGHDYWREITIAFPYAGARFWRLHVSDWAEKDRSSDSILKVQKAELSDVPLADRWQEKVGYVSNYIAADATPEYDASYIIGKDDIVNLTNQVKGDSADCSVLPEGDWYLMRFAMVSTGAKTKHGRRNLLGLECDKLSTEAAEVQFTHYAGRVVDTLRAAGIDILGVTMDSHEAGSQNWTHGMQDEFAHRREYSIMECLPMLAGWIVGDRHFTDQTLLDFRKTLSELIAERYYGTLNRMCKERDLTFTAQAIGNALCLTGDNILAKKYVEKPQGEFWWIHPNGNFDIKDCSSAAHIYGHRIASGEAFTDTKYSASLPEIKRLADYAFAFGINELVVCASSHQPLAGKTAPDTTVLHPYGFHRNNAWWEESGWFWDYQSRCAYMLRQGLPAADLCIVLGDDVPVKTLTCRLPQIPAGFDFDVCTEDGLLKRLSVDNGRIVLPDGAMYRAIVVPSMSHISPSMEQKLSEFERAGAVVIRGDTLSAAFDSAHISPQITLPDDRRMYFCHRVLDDADFYFIDNHEPTTYYGELRFASNRRHLSILDPVTGRISYRGETSTVKLSMQPHEAFFVVLSDEKPHIKAQR